MDREHRAYGAKLLNVLGDLTAASGAGIAATAMGTIPAGGVGIAIAACVAGLLTQTFIQAKGEHDAQKQGEAQFKLLLERCRTLEAALRLIAAEQDLGQIFSADKAKEMLDVLRAGQDAIAETLGRHESLLLHIGQWMSDWCERFSFNIDHIFAALADLKLQLAAGFGEVKALRKEHGRTAAESEARDLLTHQKLDEALALLSKQHTKQFDAHGEIEQAVGLLKKCDFDVAIHVLNRLRDDHWSDLTPRERFRVLANLGHAYGRRDNDPVRAAHFYLEAVAADPTHEQATALHALARLNLGEREVAHELATRAVAERPDAALGHAVRIGTFPDTTAFEEVEASVPEDLKREPDVALNLAMRVLQLSKVEGRGPSLAELAVAERYLRYAEGGLEPVSGAAPYRPSGPRRAGDRAAGHADVRGQRAPSLLGERSDYDRRGERDRDDPGLPPPAARRPCLNRQAAKGPVVHHVARCGQGS